MTIIPKSFREQHPWLYKKIKKTYWNMCQRLGVRQISWVNEEFDIRLRLLVGDNSVSKYIYLGSFEVETARFVARYCREGDIVFDIGANIGFYTALFSKLVGKAGQVHAFEPSLRELRFLAENSLFTSHKNVYLNHLAVSSQNTFREFRCFDDEMLGAYNTFGIPSHPKVQGINSIAYVTRTITLDTYVQLFGNLSPSLIKVDVEGGELEVLEGAKNLLSSDDSPVFVIEACDSTLQGFGASRFNLYTLLREAHFLLFSIETDGRIIPLEETSTPSLNLVAVKPAHIPYLTEKGLLA